MFSDITAQLIIALKCVAQQPQHTGSRNISKIGRSIRTARRYLESQIKHSMGSLWIGNKYSTPLALSALRVVKKSLPIRRER